MRRPLALLTAALAIGAVTAAPASAKNGSPSSTAIDGGATTLALSEIAGKSLSDWNVSVEPIAPATASAAGIAFPITGGALDPATGAGRLDHSGGLKLSRNGRTVTLTDFGVAIDRYPTLTAKVNGTRLPIIQLEASGAAVTSSAVGVQVTGVRALLKRAAANALNQALGVRAFWYGLELGTVSVDARRAQIVFEGGETRLALDPAAGAALASLGVDVGPIAPASAGADGSLAFPIDSGSVRTRDLAGFVVHDGGIRLSAGGTELRLTRFVIDTFRGVLTAKPGTGKRIDLLRLDLSAPQVAVDGDRVTVGNVPASLTRTAAAALNATFGVTAFTEGLRLGVATVDGDAR
jgi:hypothetical protein